MTFKRKDAVNWAQEVPGARWLKADLHIHTVDDLAGRRAKFPADINGDPQSSKTISAYARRFLQSAAERGVRVLGVTPHSPRVGTAAETSAVWQIVEEWNSGLDDDDVPFREKVYAVFPGFEPLLNDGKSGLHVLFLFDPEIGRPNYLKAFDLVMGGVEPWPNKPNNQLRMSNSSAEEAFRDLREFQDRECPRTQDGSFEWDYIALAPHIDDEKGLLGALKAQVSHQFPHAEVAGLELGDQKLPDDAIENRKWLQERMAAHRQSFFHGSDAYTVDEIGKRHTWLKLASPRIEALRQAFIANDSRVRIGYRRDANGNLSEIPDLPDVTMNKRSWLKSVRVSGKASFFGGDRAGEPGTVFELSPDLTCIIGGSMTGKSTFLDGLRVHVNAAMPDDDKLAEQVEARGKDRFLGGSPEVLLECPGQDTTATPYEQWPAVFYTQNELQRLVQNAEAVEDILARLVPSETRGIEEREERLSELDKELSRAAEGLNELNNRLADTEQAVERSQRAAAELAVFSDAGVDKLNRVSSDLRRWREGEKIARELATSLAKINDSLVAVDIPEIDDSTKKVLSDAGVNESEADFRARWERVSHFIRSAKDELDATNAGSRSIAEALKTHQEDVRVQVDRELASRGLDGARINQLQALNSQASLLASYEAHLNELRDSLSTAEDSFDTLLTERQDLVDQQRGAFDQVIEKVELQFNRRIAPRRINDGRNKPLDSFLRGLKQVGITRWWNDLTDDQHPTPQELLKKLDTDQLDEIGMSSAVQETFRAQLNPWRKRELASIRCGDSYVLELRLEEGAPRILDKLSGGQQVNTLLSLLLETNDDRPLVIDQPEDELDNRYLFETMLPALKRLKGRRQIIVATHNANIVVNGDADLVIHLEATADRGRVASLGAIEDPAVRDAIVRTVDGGDEAFRHRRLKYGF